MLIVGDCVEVMAGLPEDSVDAVVTDPPYGLEFMGKGWDRLGDVRQRGDATFTAGDRRHGLVRHGGSASYGAQPAESGNAQQAWHYRWATEALRVLKPGGHLLAFGGSRTYHRLASAVEDAGFEIRDQIMWVYASGFPKSMNVGKAMTAQQMLGGSSRTQNRQAMMGDAYVLSDSAGTIGTERAMLGRRSTPPMANVSDAAKQWQGWGTALKPAHEPIVVARKPLVGTVARNVQEWGTGALNIDGCRIELVGESAEDVYVGPAGPIGGQGIYGGTNARPELTGHPGGRWPANLILDEGAAALLDEQSGVSSSSSYRPPDKGGSGNVWTVPHPEGGIRGHNDSGGASRFFYVPKTSSAERNAGLEGFSEERVRKSNHTDERVWDIPGSHSRPRSNDHPTVKPINLMRYLIRLVTPPGEPSSTRSSAQAPQP